MRANWKDLIKLSVQQEPAEFLLDKVLNKIERKPVYANYWGKVRLVLSGMLLMAMVVLMIPVLIQLSGELSKSGLSQLVSLLFSDFNVVVVNWQDFGLSLLENLPVVAIIDFLIVLLVMVGAVGLISTNMKDVGRSKWLFLH